MGVMAGVVLSDRSRVVVAVWVCFEPLTGLGNALWGCSLLLLVLDPLILSAIWVKAVLLKLIWLMKSTRILARLP